MHIRVVTFDDLPALCKLDTFAAEYPERREAIHAWIGQGICRLAEVDGEPAGYGVLTYHFFGSAFIEMLMVDVRFRGRGVGLALVEHFQAICLGPKLFSSTNLSNRPMQSLLLKAGFKPSGYIHNLDENDPELVFFYPVP
jgi:ribosomal protein S18 acetylase RimI-like enzyme